MDSVKIHEPLCNSDHNQIHFDINVKSESKTNIDINMFFSLKKQIRTRGPEIKLATVSVDIRKYSRSHRRK